jgi:hypothetical protein
MAQSDGIGGITPARVIPPNPEAAKIATYGKYDISYYTGKPEISIPLFNITTSDLSLPINLVYESTGLKPDDLASWVGTGWILNGIGCITRVVVGMPDDYSGGYLTQQNIPYTGNISMDYYYNAVHLHTIDTEPDRYYFNFNGHSGEFTFDVSKNIVQIPLSGVRIRRTDGGFEITDEDGNLYEFKRPELAMMTVNADVDYLPQSVNTWWLTRITSTDKSDVINFYYSQDGEERELKPTYSAAYGPKYAFTGFETGYTPTFYSNNVLDYSSSVIHREYTPWRIDSISYNNGKLVFNKVRDRLDGGNCRLSSIDMYILTNNVMQKKRSVNLLTGNFQYTGPYFNNLISYSQYSGRYRLKLTGVEERKGDGTLNGNYTFGYDESMMIPYRGTLQQDYWGYYNGAIVNDQKQTLIPSQTTSDLVYTIGGANREADGTYMKAGILNKITYPTGGYTVFNWEPHKYLFSTTTEVTKSSSSIAYGNNSSNTPNPTTTVDFVIPSGATNTTVSVFISTYPRPSNPQYTNPNFQTLEENTRPNANIINLATGQTVYSYVNNNPQGTYSYTGNLYLPAGNYKLVTNCYANSTSAYSSIVVNWKVAEAIEQIKLAGGLRIGDVSNYDSNNKLVSKNTYRYGQNEVGYGTLSLSPAYFNTLSYEESFQYNYRSPGGTGCLANGTTRTLYKSEPIVSMGLASGSSVIYPVVTKYIGDATNNLGKSIYKYLYRTGGELDVSRFPSNSKGEYMVTKLGWRTPVISNEEHYKKTSTGYQLVKSTENEYVELGYKSFGVLKLGWQNQMVFLAGCYQPSVYDYYAATYYIYTGKTQLSASNTKEYDDGGNSFLQTQQTFTYDEQYRSFPVSQTLINSKGETRKTINRYPFDKASIVDLSSGQGVVLDAMVARNTLAAVIQQEEYLNTTMLRRKTNKYKIWDVLENVVKLETINLKILSNPDEPRVIYYNYDEKGNPLQEAKMNDAKEVYVWGYNYQYPVAKVKGSDYNTVIDLLDMSILQHPSNDGQLRTELNKLRTSTSLKSAEVYTYSYLPTVGITSMTDPAGKTIFYEYDAMLRLWLIRDQNGNILQQTDYQYKTLLTQ